MSQMSIGFTVPEGGDQWDASGTYRQIRTIGKLLDVSVVTYPASPTTSITVARSAVAKRQLEMVNRRRVADRRIELMVKGLRLREQLNNGETRA